jgi:hypothetical protein
LVDEAKDVGGLSGSRLNSVGLVQKYFIGLIDEVRIYNQALSQEEITWLAGRTQPFDKPF